MISSFADPTRSIQSDPTWGLNAKEKEILQEMTASEQVYSYDAFQTLRFELKLRDELVKAALAFTAAEQPLKSLKTLDATIDIGYGQKMAVFNSAQM